jgi:hypothetical protein
VRRIPIIVPHDDHGNPECCSLILPVARGDQADLTCNEYAAAVWIVAAADAEQTLIQTTMQVRESTLNVAY